MIRSNVQRRQVFTGIPSDRTSWVAMDLVGELRPLDQVIADPECAVLHEPKRARRKHAAT